MYLLHFDPPYRAPTVSGGVKVAGHYLGSCAGDAAARLAEHVAGRGSPLVRAAIAAGSTVSIVATWPGGRKDERRMKRGHRHARFCPVCNPKRKAACCG